MDVQCTSFIAELLGHDEILKFYALFLSQQNTNLKLTRQYFIYKQNMHIKQEINKQKLRQRKQYYSLATIFRCEFGCNKNEGYIYLCDGAFLWTVFSLHKILLIFYLDIYCMLLFCKFSVINFRRRGRKNEAEYPEEHLTFSYKVFDSMNYQTTLCTPPVKLKRK